MLRNSAHLRFYDKIRVKMEKVQVIYLYICVYEIKDSLDSKSLLVLKLTFVCIFVLLLLTKLFSNVNSLQLLVEKKYVELEELE